MAAASAAAAAPPVPSPLCCLQLLQDMQGREHTVERGGGGGKAAAAAASVCHSNAAATHALCKLHHDTHAWALDPPLLHAWERVGRLTRTSLRFPSAELCSQPEMKAAQV